MRLKIGKKILSILLAMVLVVTALPTFAFNAIAANSASTTVKSPVSADMRVLYDYITRFEQKVSDGTIYKNYLPAYQAYLNACKLYYACGANDNNTGLQNAANELSKAMTAMTEFTPVSAAPASTPSFSGDSTTWANGAKNYYSNVLWGESGTSASRASASSSYVSSAIYYPQLVLMYDGNTTPSFAILLCMAGTSNGSTSGSTRYVYGAVSNTDGTELTKNWTGKGDGSTLDYTYHAVATTQQLSYSADEFTSGSAAAQIRYQWGLYYTYTRYFANQIYYNGSMTDTEYSKEILPAVTTYSGSAPDFNNNDIVQSLEGNTAVYLINYKALIDAINNASINFDVSDYQFGGLSAVFAALDEATSLDPNSYDYSSDLAQAVSDCANDIETACNNLRNLDSLAGYADADLLDPTSDLESHGDAVHIDGVIYTHLADGHYSMYGQEISDNYNYLSETNLSTGERFTAVSVDYPNYIDTSNPISVYCLSDADVVKEGYTFGDIRVEELYDGKWIDEEGTTYDTNDDAAAALNNGHTLTKEYYLVGNVSNYFRYNEETGEYTQSGVELAVTYKDIDGKTYGEYEFPYVMPNPAWAHEIVGVRNQYTGTAAEARISMMTFTRFLDSSGSSTDINSTLINQYNGKIGSSTDLGFKSGTGNFAYISSFGSDESLNYDYSTPVYTANAFNFYDKSVGTNSGSYYVYEHTDRDPVSYATAANVVDVDYYIDYSDKSNNLITYNGDVPTGYQFTMMASNIYWASNDVTIKGTTSVARNQTDLTTEYTSTEASGNIVAANTGSSAPAATVEDLILYARTDNDDHTTVANLFKDSTGSVLTAFTTLDNGKSSTDTWNGAVTFTGKDSVAKNTDTSSAEAYANYILEMGTYHHIGAASGDGYILGEENYHYYNIGVSTCDRGAVREFLETFSNKVLNITKDENGRITSIQSSGELYEIESGNYSVSSYRAYLDALADAYWFIENPYNTTYYTDSDGNLVSRDDEADLDTSELIENEFTTAYNLVDGEVHALIYADEIGADIFNEEDVYTDPVQAQIIQHIIEAYENLFTRETYEADDSLYKSVIDKYYDTTVNEETGEESHVLKAEYDESITDSAKETLNTIVEIGDAAFSYQIETKGVDDYWRYVALNGEDYKNLATALSTLLSGLMPVVDESTLLSEIDTKQQTLSDSKCTTDTLGNTVQTVSYSTWKALNDAVSAANNVADENNGRDKLVASDTITVTIDGKDYTVDVIPDDTEDNYSDYQKAVNTEYVTLSGKDVSSIDDAEAYEVFDDAMKVVNTLDRDKYTDEGIAKLDELIELLTTQNVYTTLSGDDAAAFGVADNTKVKVTALTQTDPYTAELLGLITTLNENYVKKFRAEFSVQYGDDETTVKTGENQILYYGDTFNFDVESVDGITLDEDDVVTWSATLYNGLEDAEFNDDTLKGSQKVPGYTGSTLSRIADTNVKVSAKIVKGEQTEAYTVKVLNVYGRVISIIYTDTLPESTADKTIVIGGADVTAEDVPFYTFASWKVSTPDENDVVTVRASYTVEDAYNFTVTDGAVVTGASLAGETDGNTVYRANFDKLITIKPNDNVEGFYGWAVKTDDGKYQIASYSNEYSFYACADEDFVPIIAETEGDITTYTVDGKKITSDMLDSETTIEFKDTDDEEEAKASADEFVQSKLAQKAPFIAIQDAVMKNNNTKVSAFVRVTEGYKTSISSYGIYYMIGSSAYRTAVNNMLSTGQYVVTLNSKTSLSSSISFRAYINYDYDYSFSHTNNESVEDVNTKVNVLDYSNIGVAQPITQEVQG